MLSLVIPVYNEKDSLGELYAQITAVARQARLDLEVWFVDDGSTDGSWSVITELSNRDSQVHGLRFRRNFGKAAALAAGFQEARGDVVITMDADLQDDPAEIPRFLDRLAGGYDVVSGWKRKRLDPWHKVIPSRFFNRMVSWLNGVRLHDHNCGMKCYRAEVLREVRLYGELHRFVPVLAAARGFRVSEIEINHRPRRFGTSKYGFRRFAKGFLDLLTVKFLTGFSQRPQHMLGGIGLLLLLAGGLGMVALTLLAVFGLWEPSAFALIYVAAPLLLGAQFICIGFLAELLTAYLTSPERNYSVAQSTEAHEPGLEITGRNGEASKAASMLSPVVIQTLVAAPHFFKSLDNRVPQPR